MDRLYPIHTEKNACQDCYKCVRNCEVKAISISDGSARIVPERCTLCGTCVMVCPVGAKKVRDDASRLRPLLKRKNTVFAILAPAVAAEYPGVSLPVLGAALRRLGFSGIAEVATGADMVSEETARILKAGVGANKLSISGACPTVTAFIQKYRPDLVDCIVPVLSPMQAVAALIKEHYPDSGIVFFGPCIAKKRESDERPDLVDLVLGFGDLEKLFASAGVDPAIQAPDPTTMILPRPDKGLLYPIDGGMIAGVRRQGGAKPIDAISFSGMHHVHQALDGLASETLLNPVFLELLACEGGCINGPLTTRKEGTVIKRLRVLRAREASLAAANAANADIANKPALPRATPARRLSTAKLARHWNPETALSPKFDDAAIRSALLSVGKDSPEKELNCASCGYESCRDFAAALLAGLAETTMCISYMRNLVQKKANALLRTMPSGVVVVDRELKIVESNRPFARLMGPDIEHLFSLKPGLDGADLTRILPSTDSFELVLSGECPSIEEDLRIRGQIVHACIFPIETGAFVGALFQDVTSPTVRRDRVVEQAKKVIDQNLKVVQKVARLLGENAAETEAILSSVINAFETPEVPAASAFLPNSAPVEELVQTPALENPVASVQDGRSV